ncbi:filamentous hemagglutinin N-terminal domain-containing protein, partial [Microbulbifer mangrovi]|uniref:filamentous hemagglutinin N-terminal domain-containing protein n=1 Tax=Microbulbifer mangrovi TaxID=927787 RepID=UPI001300DDD9
MNMKRNLLSVAVSLAGIGLFASQSASAEPGAIENFTIDGADLDADAITALTDTSVTDKTKYTIDGDFAKIDWTSFGIEEGKIVEFLFNNGATFDPSAMVINKVLNGTTDIAGAITSNGHVVLINPRGVLFSEKSSVNVAALTVASMDADNFGPDGSFEFSLAEAAGEISVAAGGEIFAPSGITLIGASVTNAGDLTAAENGELVSGNINFHAGEKMTLTLEGGLVTGVAISEEAAVNEFGVDFGVINSGRLEAVQVVMEARAADSLLSAAVNNTGTVIATGIDTSGGTITLGAYGPGSATIDNNGSLTVSNGEVENAVAGTINVAAKEIVLGADSALIADANTYTNTDTDPVTVIDTVADGGDITVSASQSLTLDGTISSTGNGSGSTGGTVKTISESSISGASAVSVVTEDGDAADGGEWQVTAQSVALDGVDCADNCISSAAVVGALDDNATVTIDANAEALTVEAGVVWSGESSLKLESENTVALAAGQAVTASNGSLNVIAVNGFSNNADVDVGNFSLDVGALNVADESSPTVSSLGDLQSANTLAITNLGGNHHFDVSAISSISEIELSGGVTNLKSDSSTSIASITDADGVVVGEGVTLFGNNGADGVADDAFILSVDGKVEYDDVIFENLDAVNGLGGLDTIDASAFSVGVSLTDTAGELDADGLVITGITEITTGTLTGSTNQESFDLAADATLSVDTYTGYKFYGVTNLNGNGGSDS